jgi:TonB-dependent starch-binding outer membrane protein SusC
MIKNLRTRRGVALCCWIVLFLSFSPILYAFNDNNKVAQTITGTVTDDKNEPLVGASVVVKGTTNGTLTDASGQFNLTVPDAKTVLVITFIGYQTQEIVVGTQTTLNIVLAEDATALNEVVILGYLPTKRENILGAVGNLKAEQLAQVTPVSTFDAVQGRLSGVRIANNGGPGEGFDIQIRGVSTLSAGNGPLYIVDGQQLENIDNINPNDIESLEILKDGATAAIYGSRAANGVVLITTKSGKAGRAKLQISQQLAFNEMNSRIPLATTSDRLYYEGRGPERGVGIADSLNILFFNSHNLLDSVTRVGARSVTNVSLSGGLGKTRYAWNTGFTNFDGIIKNNNYNRINSTLRLDNEFNKWISAGIRLAVSKERRKGFDETGVFQQMVERIPYFPIIEPDGTYTPDIANRNNPLGWVNYATRDRNIFKTQGFSYFELKPLSWLRYKFNIGGNYSFLHNKEFSPSSVRPNRSPATGSERRDFENDYQLEHLVYLNKSFKKTHNITGVFGYTFQKWTRELGQFSAVTYLSDNIQTFNNVREINAPGTTSTASVNALSGLFGNLAYDYKGRYLINGIVRRDGSSRFGADNRYGIFPSFSVGWNVSKEPFMKKYTNVVSKLLFRAGFGTVGNERIGDYSSQYLLRPGFSYAGINGTAPFQLENPILGWESTISTNYAMDMELFKGRVEFSVDLWNKKTKDLLYQVPVPVEIGFGRIQQNIGSIRNYGLDVQLGATVIKTKNFSWKSDFNITFLRNEVTSLADPKGFEVTVGSNSGAGGSPISYRVDVGKPLGLMYTYVNNGVFPYNQSNAFTPDGTQLTPVFSETNTFVKYQLNGADYTGEVRQLRVGTTVLGGGDIWWKDLNGDFNIDAANDRTVTGYGNPTHYGGWNNSFDYKGFQLSILVDYTFGGNIFRAYDSERNDMSSANETPSPDRIRKAWLRPGDIAEYASFNRARTSNALANSAYIDKADYIRFRNIRLQYRLPASITKRTRLFEAISAMISVNNPLTLTNYKGFNPELGSRESPVTPGLDRLRYPSYREVIFGLTLDL